jgi:WD repeat-containing protein 35
MLDKAWHGAEAYHFLLIAQRHLYSGDTASAMAAALRLCEYEDVLDPREVHALIALTAFYANCFGTASRAFVKLECMETLPREAREAYAALALSIFARTRPVDPLDQASSVVCPVASCKAVLKAWATKCSMCGLGFKACMASGKPILSAPGAAAQPDTVQCKACRHTALRACAAGRASCPLCHAAWGPQAGSS